MENIAFQLAWLGEHKVLIFLFFAELLVAACLLIVFLHLRLSWRRLNFNKSDDKGSLNGFDLVDDPCFLLRSSDLFPLYVTKDFERQLGLTKEHFKNDVLCLSPKLPEEQAKRLRKEYNAWDGKRPILMDIEPLGMDACYRLSVARKDGMDLFHFRDITEEKRQLDEMRADLEAAENVSQSKSAYLSEMSHEIRTPLNAIVGFSDLLSDTSGFTEEEIGQFIATINKNCGLLLALINDILDLSRIESGTMEFMFANHNLPLLLKTVHDSQQLNMPPRVELLLRMPDNEKKYLVTDNVRLQQVVNNLINNAAKFTTYGSITFGYEEDEDPEYTRIFVEDTGVGISEEGIRHIFERFYKVDNFTQGAGLGLSICQTIVERLRGTIFVTSEVGRGTRFTVRIPNFCE